MQPSETQIVTQLLYHESRLYTTTGECHCTNAYTCQQTDTPT